MSKKLKNEIQPLDKRKSKGELTHSFAASEAVYNGLSNSGTLLTQAITQIADCVSGGGRLKKAFEISGKRVDMEGRKIFGGVTLFIAFLEVMNHIAPILPAGSFAIFGVTAFFGGLQGHSLYQSGKLITDARQNKKIP